MSNTYHIQRRFHIGYSILGRQIRRRISDVHYAEGVFIMAFAALFICLVIANYLGWAVLQSMNAGAPDEAAAIMYWIGQVILTLLFFTFCVFGFKPAVHVSFDSQKGLSIKQGAVQEDIPLQSIRAVSHVSALRFHRHHRKYRTTKAFFVKLPASLTLVSTDNGPVLLGLSEDENQELITLLQPQSEKIVFSTLSPIA